MLLYHVFLWTPVMLVYIPSSILSFLIVLLIVAARKRIPQYNSLFYRLFVIQTILDNFQIFLYIAGRILIREGMAGSLLIMSTNSWIFGVFPKIYYFGTVCYFYNTQLWGMILQSLTTCVAICAPDSKTKRVSQLRDSKSELHSSSILVTLGQLLGSIPDSAWWFIKTAVPTANLIAHAVREPVRFELHKFGSALLYVPTNIIELLAKQATIITILAIIFSATCYVLILKKLIRFKRTSGSKSIAKYRQKRNTAAVGCMLVISLCTMAAYNLIVAFTAVKFGRPPHFLRHLMIIPVLLMTFVQPWMLLATDSNLRRALLSNGAKQAIKKKQVYNQQNME